MGKRVERTRNNGRWTEARFRQFIRSALRNASRKWGPINDSKKAAWVSRGKYKCNGCKKVVPLTLNKKANIFVDHIEPIVDPEVGFVDWNTFIERLFCEADNLQVLCKSCHDKKSKKEREKASGRTL